MSRLEGKHALITGAARGIGLAIAERFMQEGARVTVSDIRDDEGAKAVDALGSRARYEHLDVTDEGQWERLVARLDDIDPVDILVNNAGAVLSFAPLHQTSPELFRRILDLNLTSCFLGLRYVIPGMRARGGGSIVNLSSISGVVGHDVAPAYQSAKGGIRVLTKNAAVTYVRDGIRVNSIHPGIIATPMVSEQPQWATDAFVAATPMGRPGDADDIAYAAVYLACEESKFVTGAELYVDGGFTAV